MKQLIFVKLGGSLITDKEVAMKPRPDIIAKIARNIAGVLKQYPSVSIILGNGAGSFGHFQALKYGVHKSMKTTRERYGYAVVQDAVAQLNRIVIAACLKEDLPVVSVPPSAVMQACDGKVDRVAWDTWSTLIKENLIPSVYGDIILDSKRGSTIFSTETVFDILLEQSIQQALPVKTVLYLSVVPGVLDDHGNTIPSITAATWAKQQASIQQTIGFDVTGGMKHKVERALELAKKGIQTTITNDYSIENLSAIFSQEKSAGTTIS